MLYEVITFAVRAARGRDPRYGGLSRQPLPQALRLERAGHPLAVGSDAEA